MKGASLIGYVWWCGDEYCDCYQPQISVRGSFGGPDRGIWSGTFRTDSQYRAAANELNRTAQAMRRKCHSLYEKIEWPWDRDE